MLRTSLSARRWRGAALAATASVAVLALSIVASFAGDESTGKADAAPHMAAVAGAVVLAILASAGVGCAIAVVSAAFPTLAASMDRHTRAAGTWSPVWIGSVVAFGSAIAVAGAAKAGGGGALLGLLVIGVPTLLLWTAGMMAVLPLLGERLLGRSGTEAGPLKRAVVGSVALSLAFLPGAVSQIHVVNVVLAFLVFGWPLGVGLLALFARLRRPAPPAM